MKPEAEYNEKAFASVRRTKQSWYAMKGRCAGYGERNARYYKANCISFDPRWSDFRTFLTDMGLRPVGMTLDRIDGDGGYWPGNCRWADQATQTRNRRAPTEPPDRPDLVAKYGLADLELPPPVPPIVAPSVTRVSFFRPTREILFPDGRKHKLPARQAAVLVALALCHPGFVTDRMLAIVGSSLTTGSAYGLRRALWSIRSSFNQFQQYFVIQSVPGGRRLAEEIPVLWGNEGLDA